jgi:hypothetical protein
MFWTFYRKDLHKNLLKSITTFNFSQYKYYLNNIKIKNSAESIADGKIMLDDEEKSSSDMSNKLRRLKTK